MQIKHMAAILLAVSLPIVASTAQAKPRKTHTHAVTHSPAQQCVLDNSGRTSCQGAVETRQQPRQAVSDGGSDPRPGAWCMWWLRRHLGIPKSAFRPYEYNLARAGRYIGSSANGPAPGVIVVWWHHVGVITGGSPGHWIVLSGNDGHAVRERERSLNGVIAYRWPNDRIASR